MTNPQDLEPRVNQIEVGMEAVKQTGATLANIVSSHETQIEESRQRFCQFLMQAEANRAQATSDRDEARQTRHSCSSSLKQLLRAVTAGSHNSHLEVINKRVSNGCETCCEAALSVKRNLCCNPLIFSRIYR
jgi:hypothetical protein